MICKRCRIGRLQPVADQIQQGLHAFITAFSIETGAVDQRKTTEYFQAVGVSFFHMETAVSGENCSSRFLHGKGSFFTGILSVVLYAFGKSVHGSAKQPEKPVLAGPVKKRTDFRYPAILQQGKLLRNPQVQKHPLRRPDTRAGKLKGYCAVTEQFFILNGLLAAGDGAVVYLSVCVEMVKRHFVLFVVLVHKLFEIFHRIPLFLFNVLYGWDIADTGEQMREAFDSKKDIPCGMP